MRCLANSYAKHPGSCVVRYRPINSSSLGPFTASLLCAPPCITGAAHQFHTARKIFFAPQTHTHPPISEFRVSSGRDTARASPPNSFRPARSRTVITHLASAMWVTRTGQAEEELRRGCRSYRLYPRHNKTFQPPSQRSHRTPQLRFQHHASAQASSPGLRVAQAGVGLCAVARGERSEL